MFIIPTTKHTLSSPTPSQAANWLRVNKNSPCSICGKPDWCLVSADGSAAICQRVQSDKQCGDAGWLHRLTEAQVPVSLPKRRAHAHEAPRASAEVLDTVYTALLSELSLTQTHLDNLLARGMSKAQIAAGGYKTLSRAGRPALVARLTQRVHSGELPVLAGVPGFYMVTGELQYANLSGSAGMLVPIKDTAGLIVGLQVRADSVSQGGKYRWISSPGQFGGCSSGSPVHIAKPQGDTSGCYAVITEGALKAEIIASRLNCIVMGVAGVGNSRGAVEAVRSLGIKEVVVAYDTDKVTNPAVKHHSKALALALLRAGVAVYEATWSAKHKGLDDFLYACEFYVQQIAKLSTLEAKLKAKGVLLSLCRVENSQAYKKSSRDRVYEKHYKFIAGKAWRGWHNYLEDRGSTKPLDCLQYGYVHNCEEHEHVVFEPHLCGDRYHCVICGFRYEQIQAKAAMLKFNAIAKVLPGVELLRLVFTLPRELWPKITWVEFGKFNKLAIASITEYFGGQVAGELNSQYWPSAKPLPDKYGYFPHIHGSMVNVVRAKDGTYKVVPAFLDALRLKIIWARRLGKAFKLEFRLKLNSKTGQEMPQLKLKKGWSNINLRLVGFVPIDDERYVYTRGKRKGQQAKFTNKQYLRARLRYDFRMPQGDIAEFGDKARLEVFSAKQKLGIDTLLGRDTESARIGRPKNFRRERWFGWLGDGVVRKRLAELSIRIPSAKERKEEAKEAASEPIVCPEHECVCSQKRGQFGSAISQSRWWLNIGDICLSANFRQDKRWWLITPAIYERWHPPREPAPGGQPNDKTLAPIRQLTMSKFGVN